MTDYGGLGGVSGGRAIDATDAFEMAVDRAMGEAMRADKSLCIEVWSALANGEWSHVEGDTASYSFRAAGDLVAAVHGRGDYMDWYCSGPYPHLSDRVREAMAGEGWTWRRAGP